MQLIIHVGLPKCGSTTLQQCFAGMRESLSAQGIFYPPSFRHNHEAANTKINNEWIDGRIGVDAVVQAARAAGATQCLLSSEFIAIGIDRYAPEVLRQAADWLEAEGVQLTLIQVSRTLDPFLASLYRQTVSNAKGISELYSEIDWTPHSNAYAQGLEGLVQYLRPAEVRRYRLEEAGWLEAVFGDLGLAPPVEVPRANRSAPDVAIEMLRQFSAMGEAAPHRVYITRLFSLAIGPANNILFRQASRRAPEEAVPMTREVIESLRYIPNPPLRYDEDTFSTFRQELLSVYDRHAEAFGVEPRPFLRGFRRLYRAG